MRRRSVCWAAAARASPFGSCGAGCEQGLVGSSAGGEASRSFLSGGRVGRYSGVRTDESTMSDIVDLGGDEFSTPDNLDKFFTNIYEYHRRQGFATIAIKWVSRLLCVLAAARSGGAAGRALTLAWRPFCAARRRCCWC